MKPADYDLLVLPEKTEENSNHSTKSLVGTISKNLLAPNEYIKELEERNAYYTSFKTKIAKSGLQNDMANQLHSAYQGNFK